MDILTHPKRKCKHFFQKNQSFLESPLTVGENADDLSIGDNTVIGAGSVVTKDIPAGVVAVGNPCKVLREVGEKDKIYYWRDKKIDWDELNK